MTYPQQVTGWSSTVTLFDATTGEWVGEADVDAHQNRYRIDRPAHGDLPRGVLPDPRFRHRRGTVLERTDREPGPRHPDRRGDRGQPRRPTSTRRWSTAASSPASSGTARAPRWRGARSAPTPPTGSLVTRESPLHRCRRDVPGARPHHRQLPAPRLRRGVRLHARYYDGVGQTTTNAVNAVAVGAHARGRRPPSRSRSSCRRGLRSPTRRCRRSPAPRRRWAGRSRPAPASGTRPTACRSTTSGSPTAPLIAGAVSPTYVAAGRRRGQEDLGAGHGVADELRRRRRDLGRDGHGHQRPAADHQQRSCRPSATRRRRWARR